jgi:putative intracellular protease/amidase
MSLKDPNIVNAKAPKRVAIVISNPAVSTTTGWPVGFWWSELAHPYSVFSERGYEIEIFSPNGGKCEADAMSDPRDPSGYVHAGLWRGFAIRDGNLITGQQNFSGSETARLVVQAIGA